jgi:hypothetical protein
MGLLTSGQEQKCYLYLGYLGVNRTGVFVGGQPQTTEVVHKLQASLDNLTPNGAANCTALLTTLDGLYSKLITVDGRFQARKAGKVDLNPNEWQDRMGQWNFFRRQLAVQLDVALDPWSEADAAGSGRGPYREP